MSKQSSVVRFLYGSKTGNAILKVILTTHADKVAVAFLRSPMSRVVIRKYVKKHNISLDRSVKYRSFSKFFIRKRDNITIDKDPHSLISPCDGWLSVFPISEDSSFHIKGSDYKLDDIIKNNDVSKLFYGGSCLIFRLCASDYHRYCYIDNGYQEEHNYIAGTLHSVQPAACERYPIYTLNRRTWSLMQTENFGKVLQSEIGALIVGGIVNNKENSEFTRGEEKGYFDLAGSTIVMMFQKGKIELLDSITKELEKTDEVRVLQGMRIGQKAIVSGGNDQ